MKSLWKNSLAFRRFVAATVFVIAALIAYLATRITVAVSLPMDDLNRKAEARLGEEVLLIEHPQIKQGGLVLSYNGGKNELADLSFEKAVVTGQSRLELPPAARISAASKIKFTYKNVAVPESFDDTCHTAIEIRLAKGAPPLDSLKLYQTDTNMGSQRFRQVILDAGASPLEVTVSTDPPRTGMTRLPGCQRLISVGDAPPADWPPTFPVVFAVPGGTIDLHFNPASPALPIFTGPDQTYQAVSVGEDSIQSTGLHVVSTRNPTKKQRLDVRPSPTNSLITVGSLRLGSKSLGLDVGQDAEKAVPFADGKALYPLDITATIKNNGILSGALGLLYTALVIWVQRICFPSLASKDQT